MRLITPWRQILLNRILRKLGCNYSIWKIYANWVIFKDHHNSNTTETVFREIISGVYQPQYDLSNQLIFDLGAHVGMFSIPLAKKYPDAFFICVEANPRNYENLYRNLLMNDVKNVLVYENPIGQKDKLVYVVHNHKNTGGSYVLEYETKSAGAHGEKCITLDELFSNHGRPSLLKIDIEGHEYKVLTKPSHLKGIKSVIAEVHLNDNFNGNKFVEFIEHNCLLTSITIVGNQDEWLIHHKNGQLTKPNKI